MKRSSKRSCLLGLYNRTTGHCISKKRKLRIMIKSKKTCKTDQVRDRSTGRCRKRKSPKKSARTPCRSDQVRDRSTGRCRKRNSPKKSARTPCRSDEVRDLSTGRCHKLSQIHEFSPSKKTNYSKSKSRSKTHYAFGRSKKSARTPCRSDEVRDRSTGRCRKRNSPKKSARTPCRSDEVRYRSTGRCRKLSQISSKKSRSKTHYAFGRSKKSAQTPCRSDQVRNRSTGSCRKSSNNNNKNSNNNNNKNNNNNNNNNKNNNNKNKN